MRDFQLLWGDAHTHLVDMDNADQILREAELNIDFTVVLLYPFVYEYLNGFRVESTGNRPEFLRDWQRINEFSHAHYRPGQFTTFPGYEWHGNRTLYGDHNIIYRREGYPLDDTWSLPELYNRLREREALAIPHHTAYRVGSRAKDWQVYDAGLSPVMEVYSQHGSSEGVGTTEFMAYNSSMGPGTSGGTFRDALARGLRVGVIGSNDGAGLPGRWGNGRAAVWASENTREAIWQSLLERRTYAVSGDRIVLDFSIDDVPMGGSLEASGQVTPAVQAVGTNVIDRIELIQDGRVVQTHAPFLATSARALPGRVKVFIEAGWGPAAHNGFALPENGWQWEGEITVQAGRIVGVEKCFSLLGQRVIQQEPDRCVWTWTTAARRTRHEFGTRQGLIFELEGEPDMALELQLEGENMTIPLQDLLFQSRLVPLMDEVQTMVQEQFGVGPQAVSNPDAYYQNARKFVVHRAAPSASYEISHVFRDVQPAAGGSSFYVRVIQANGQMAWSSPIWVEGEG